MARIYRGQSTGETIIMAQTSWGNDVVNIALGPSSGACGRAHDMKGSTRLIHNVLNLSDLRCGQVSPASCVRPTDSAIAEPASNYAT